MLDQEILKSMPCGLRAQRRMDMIYSSSLLLDLSADLQ